MYLYFNQYHTVAESVIIFLHFKYYFGEMPCVSDSKASACNAGDLGQSLDQEDLLEKEMATHSSTLAWTIPRIEETSRLQSMGSQSQTRLSSFTSQVKSYIYIFVIEISSFIFLLLHTIIKYPYLEVNHSPGVICTGVVLMKCQIYI